MGNPICKQSEPFKHSCCLVRVCTAYGKLIISRDNSFRIDLAPSEQGFTLKGKKLFSFRLDLYIGLDKKRYEVFFLFLHKNMCSGYSLEAPR